MKSLTAADEWLFKGVLRNELHVLQPLLPDKTNITYNPRSRHHNRQLIKTRSSANAKRTARPFQKY